MLADACNRAVKYVALCAIAAVAWPCVHDGFGLSLHSPARNCLHEINNGIPTVDNVRLGNGDDALNIIDSSASVDIRGDAGTAPLKLAES